MKRSSALILILLALASCGKMKQRSTNEADFPQAKVYTHLDSLSRPMVAYSPQPHQVFNVVYTCL